MDWPNLRLCQPRLAYLYLVLALQHSASKMPIHLLASAVFGGVSFSPFVIPTFKVLSLLCFIWLLKRYFGGSSNMSERLMHSKVVMITVFEVNIPLKVKLMDIGWDVRCRCDRCSATCESRRPDNSSHPACALRSFSRGLYR